MNNDHYATDSDQTVLVIGGTGMLHPAVHQLVDRGMTVLLVSRKPYRAAPSQDGPGQFIPVPAQWQQPAALADAVQAATGGCVSHVLVWVHSPYRSAVLAALDQVIAPNAVVVNVWGSASQNPREVALAEADSLPGREIRDLLLGYVSEDGRARWLTHTEVSDGVLQTLDGSESVHVVGQIDPWDQRP